MVRQSSVRLGVVRQGLAWLKLRTAARRALAFPAALKAVAAVLGEAWSGAARSGEALFKEGCFGTLFHYCLIDNQR
jgi:hypothetical protein